MEELTLTTPSILFSAISLLMLAYTNRFLAYAQVIRNLTAQHDQNPTPVTRKQIENLRKRLYLSRSMQVFGVGSLFLCVVCTLLVYIGMQTVAVWTFGVALLLLIARHLDPGDAHLRPRPRIPPRPGRKRTAITAPNPGQTTEIRKGMRKIFASPCYYFRNTGPKGPAEPSWPGLPARHRPEYEIELVISVG